MDIIAKIYDKTGIPINQNPVWEKMIPMRISYEIHGPQNVPERLSFLFRGYLYYSSNVNVVYKNDQVCTSRGDYENRDFYFIVTNTDGDTLIEATDANYSWNTTGFPPGNYWIVVKAMDAAGNTTKDSMMVTIPGQSVEENYTYLIARTSIVNSPKALNELFCKFAVKLYDVNGRVQSDFHNLPPGVYFAIYKDNGELKQKKIVIIK